MDKEKEEKIQMCRHSLSHVLAKAITNLYGKDSVKLAIGPAIDNGFYYDFDMPSLSQDKFEEIEKEMKAIISRGEEFRRVELSKEDALKLFAGQPYKVELLGDIPEGEEISFYTQGDFADLCSGPHLNSTGRIKAFKLTSLTGAYWR